MQNKSRFALRGRLACLLTVLAVCLLTTVVPAAASSAAWRNYPALGATSGDVFTYVRGSGNFEVGSEGDPQQFVGISIGGYVLSSNVYVVTGTACNINISGNYLATFDDGEYPVRIVFKDGETNATLKIVKAQTTPPPAASQDPGMLEGGAPGTAGAQNAGTVDGPNTGLDTVLLGILAITGGSAALFGLSKKWLAL